MGSSEKGEAVVVFAEAEVEAADALVEGRLEQGNAEAERGRERLAELGDGVDEGVKGEELWASNRSPPTREKRSGAGKWRRRRGQSRST